MKITTLLCIGFLIIGLSLGGTAMGIYRDYQEPTLKTKMDLLDDGFLAGFIIAQKKDSEVNPTDRDYKIWIAYRNNYLTGDRKCGK